MANSSGPSSIVALRKFLSPTALRLAPRLTLLLAITKLGGLLLLLANLRSLPLIWHLRLFRPVFYLRARLLLLRLRLFLLFRSREQRRKEELEWLESLCPIGQSPRTALSVYKSWASIDDTDFNGHLSNSSYAKALDHTRMKAALQYFPAFLRAGGWIALAGTNYQFIREIPMYTSYEVRLNIASWDNKWLFLVTRFVTRGKHPKKHSPSSQIKPDLEAAPSVPAASLHTPSSPLSSPPGTPSPSNAQSGSALNTHRSLQSLALADAAAQSDEDGVTLHCLAVSQVCCKHGRITVPPAVVFASEGMCMNSPDDAVRYDYASPPPHFLKAKALRMTSMKAFVAFLRGGWKEEEQRWWEGVV